jgi:hypothetical protein
MRTFTFVAFLAVAFTAIAAAPHAQTGVSIHKLNTEVGVKVGEDFLLDLISLILGVDVRQILAQADATISGLEALLQSSSNELVTILASGGADIIAQAEAIINGAVAEAQEIVAPIVRIIEIIAGLITRTPSNKNLIEDLIKGLLNSIIALIDGTIADLEALVVRTVQSLDQLAQSAGQEIGSQVDALLVRTVAEGVALVEPLIELIKPLLPPSTAVVVNGALEDLIVVIIELITGINIPAVIEQAKATAAGLQLLAQLVVQELQSVLGAAGSELVAQVQAILTEAIAEAEGPITKVLELAEKVAAGNVLLIPALLVALDNASQVLPGIVESAIGQLVAVVNQVGGDALAQVEQIVSDAIAEAGVLIQALLDLLSPSALKRLAKL